ncbi:MAG: SPFH domain-containing protein [Candidatus Thorarchaeota archaeon]
MNQDQTGHVEEICIQTTTTLVMIGMMVLLIVFMLAFMMSGLKVLKEWDRVAVFRRGKFYGIRGPGIIWKMPFLDKTIKFSLREQVWQVETERIITTDNTSRVIKGLVGWRIVNAEAAILAVEDYKAAAIHSIQHHIREVTESLPGDAVITNNEDFVKRVQEELNATFEKWGLVVTRVELRGGSHLDF